jgi:hypothetical protein
LVIGGDLLPRRSNQRMVPLQRRDTDLTAS